MICPRQMRDVLTHKEHILYFTFYNAMANLLAELPYYLMPVDHPTNLFWCKGLPFSDDAKENYMSDSCTYCIQRGSQCYYCHRRECKQVRDGKLQPQPPCSGCNTDYPLVGSPCWPCLRASHRFRLNTLYKECGACCVDKDYADMCIFCAALLASYDNLECPSCGLYDSRCSSCIQRRKVDKPCTDRLLASNAECHTWWEFTVQYLLRYRRCPLTASELGHEYQRHEGQVIQMVTCDDCMYGDNQCQSCARKQAPFPCPGCSDGAFSCFFCVLKKRAKNKGIMCHQCLARSSELCGDCYDRDVANGTLKSCLSCDLDDCIQCIQRRDLVSRMKTKLRLKQDVDDTTVISIIAFEEQLPEALWERVAYFLQPFDYCSFFSAIFKHLPSASAQLTRFLHVRPELACRCCHSNLAPVRISARPSYDRDIDSEDEEIVPDDVSYVPPPNALDDDNSASNHGPYHLTKGEEIMRRAEIDAKDTHRYAKQGFNVCLDCAKCYPKCHRCSHLVTTIISDGNCNKCEYFALKHYYEYINESD